MASEKSAMAKEPAPKKAMDLLYAVGDNPPWYLCIVLGLQVSLLYCTSSTSHT